MSTSKKKRMGSQRRPLNQNVPESPETSDATKSPPMQGRQRADAKADLTLSPDSAQSEIPVRKKKLGSQRGNKGKQSFKESDVTTEPSHEPFEEMNDSTTNAQAPDRLDLKNESFDESVERNSAGGSGVADLLHSKSSNANTSTLTAAISSKPQSSDVLDASMDQIRSEWLLNDGQSEKSLPKITSTQEGVLTEMDLAQQMPDIVEATLPAGVTGESTCSVRLIEPEDINITGSHDQNNTLNLEAGLIEKPVCPQSNESSLPIAKIRKIGSSRRRKEVNIKEIQDQSHVIAAESNNEMETAELTTVQHTQEVTLLDNTYREEGQPKTHASQMVQNIEEPHIGELLVDFKDEEVKEAKPHKDEDIVGSKELSEMSSMGISTTEQVFEETDKPAENTGLDDALIGETNYGLFATDEMKEKDKKLKDETLVRSFLSEIPSELEREKSFTAQFITKDETVTELGEQCLGAQITMQSSTEELLRFDQNDSSDLQNVSASPEPEDVNEVDMHKVTSPSVVVTEGDKGASSVDRANTEDTFTKNANLIEQQCNISSDGVSTIPDVIYKGEEQRESKPGDDETQILAPLVSVNTSLDYVCDGTTHDITTEGILKTETVAAVVQHTTITNSMDPKEDANFGLFDTVEGVDDSSAGFAVRGESTDKLLFNVISNRENERGVFSEQQPETQINFTLSTDQKEEDQGEMQLVDEHLVVLQNDKLSEPQVPQIQQLDTTNASLATPLSENTASLQDVTPSHPELLGNRRKLGSSRKIKGRKQANDEANTLEDMITPVTEGSQLEPALEQKSTMDNEMQEVDKDLRVYDDSWETTEDSHKESILSFLSQNKKKEIPSQDPPSVDVSKDGQTSDSKVLTPAEVTALFEEEQTVESNAPKNILANIEDNVLQLDASIQLESPKDTEINETETGIFGLKEQINVHQLTFISDSEAHEETYSSFLLQAEQPRQGESFGETSEAAQLVNELEVNASNTDLLLGPGIKIPVEVTTMDEDSLKDTAETGLPRDNDISNTEGGLEEKSSGKTEEAVQPVVIFSEDIPEVQTSADPQINADPKRRKMGSTRRSHLNRKQQDEEKCTEDNENIFDNTPATDEKAIITAMNEDAQLLSSDALEKLDDVSIAAIIPVQDQLQNENNAEMLKLTQEDEKKQALPTEETAVMDSVNVGPAILNLQPVSEDIQPASPGKRRKMGSTRKNLSSKIESPPEEMVTPELVEKEVVSITSNENIESKEHSGLLIHAVSVHQKPPNEATPLSQQDNQGKLRSKSELESSLPNVMAEDAARRRKMGSHRRPHTDQDLRQGQDNAESLLHPLEERRFEQPNMGQLSEVNERGNRAFSTAGAFDVKRDFRPVDQRIPQQLSQPSANVRRAQQSHLRLASGYDLSASKFEVVMIGDSSVGKTSFIQRAQSGQFAPDVPASIGMDSYKWTMVIDGKTVVLHLWDTAGQERFHSMTKQIFHRAQAFLLMYDITCSQTFTAVSYWANCIRDGAGDNVVILLLGNKSDSQKRKVRREEGELLAQENDFAFLECSAATGENVIEALETVARLLSQKAARREEPLLLRKPEPRNKGCC